MTVLARNGVIGTPIIIEYAEDFPFEPGERERDWHEASDTEYAAYVAANADDDNQDQIDRDVAEHEHWLASEDADHLFGE